LPGEAAREEADSAVAADPDREGDKAAAKVGDAAAELDQAASASVKIVVRRFRINGEFPALRSNARSVECR